MVKQKEKYKNKEEYLSCMRHSTAHLLAAAVMQLYPDTKRAIGPAIENGFYYDFEFKKPISTDDLAKIEAKMRLILPTWKEFKRVEVDQEEARKMVKDNPYKLELIDEFSQKGETITFYQSGNFIDLCKGGHLANPAKEIGSFKLLSLAGAYWRGDEKNPMLTRIYGTSFPTKKELDHYLWQLEEARKRDHKKIGPALDLFHFQPEAPGMPFWHPKGMIVRNELLKFSQQMQQKYCYDEVSAPNLLAVELFKRSGHWNHYKDQMYFTIGEGDKHFALRPMDCPGTIQIYKFKQRSYRELPLRLAEYGTVTRKEKSGELSGLLRVAQITQDDAHIFATENQIQQVVKEVIQLTEEMYQPFNLPYRVYLSTRPDDFMGKISVWDRAEKALKNAMEAANLPILIKEKDGAFYGPKIDYQLKDALGRTWQCATIQLDFQMPKAFDLNYIDKDSKKKRPVIIHRTILGAIERFIGILIEHYAGALPLWLSPVQVAVLPISDKQREYANIVYQQLTMAEIRAELDDSNETLSKRIRNWEMQKVPYLVVVGKKEEEKGKITVRKRGEGDKGTVALKSFIDQLKKEIKSRKCL